MDEQAAGACPRRENQARTPHASGTSRARREREALRVLSGPGAEAILRAAAGELGEDLTDWRVHAVHHRPGAGVSVGYSVSLRSTGARKVTRPSYLCASTARLSNHSAPGLVRVSSAALPGQQVHVWRHPGDPELPALAAACTPSLLVARLGAQPWLSAPVRAAVVSYRPTRRAVVRVDSSRGRAWVKVLRPAQAEAYLERHRLLAGAGLPLPRLLAAEDDGLVVLGQGRGVPLASMLAQGMSQSRAASVLGCLTGVLDRLPEQAGGLRRRPSWSERVASYARAAAAVLPDQSSRIQAVSDAVARLMETASPGPVVTTHGDFYEANVLMDGGVVSCLLDIDSVGPGYRVDDLACLLGHVSVLDHLAPASYRRVRPVLEDWTRLAASQAVAGGAEPAALYARCAGVVLSLVAGAQRQDGRAWRQDALGRLAEAEAWLARAGAC